MVKEKGDLLMEYYHMIIQSHAGKNILRDEDDCVFFLQTTKRAFEKYNIRWLAYAVMPTHIHVGAYGELSLLKKARHNICYTYGVFARKKYPEFATGRRLVFKEENEMKFLQTNYDMKRVIRYAHQNPIKKNLETKIGESIRSSYSAVLARWNPKDMQNPFNRYVELQAIRDAISVEDVSRVFGRNINEQKQEYFAFHEIYDEEVCQAKNLEGAETILKEFFNTIHAFREKNFDAKGRKAFLTWLSGRGNPWKATIVLRLATELGMAAGEIASFLALGETTVRRILKNRH